MLVLGCADANMLAWFNKASFTIPVPATQLTVAGTTRLKDEVGGLHGFGRHHCFIW